ncbi:MAG: beta-N-acetylhexosaminidase [Planctomycetes bacterium]|nr:beta-N-acetylhexosaminidase [Planctomycetota bacterium]
MHNWSRTAGEVLMVGLEGPRLGDEERRRLAALGPAGVILFRRNLETPRQTAELLADARSVLGPGSLAALDQEGGSVSRLEPWIGPTADASVLAKAGEETLNRFGRSTARALATLGFNVDFAPVVDLCGPEQPNEIAARSFGRDPVRSARLAGAFLDGLQSGGVAGCLKHFPGLGSTSVDSHVALPESKRTLEQIEREDLEPYRILGTRAAAVMVAHCHYPALDPGLRIPASGSRAAIAELLRRGVGYDGLVVTDDLEMGAIGERDSNGEFAVQALEAGCDLLLYCAKLDRAERAAERIAAAAARTPSLQDRLSEAAARVRTTAERWAPSTPSSAAWSAIAAEFAEFAPR